MVADYIELSFVVPADFINSIKEFIEAFDPFQFLQLLVTLEIPVLDNIANKKNFSKPDLLFDEKIEKLEQLFMVMRFYLLINKVVNI